MQLLESWNEIITYIREIFTADQAADILKIILKIGFTLLVVWIAAKIASYLVKKIFFNRFNSRLQVDEKRTDTIYKLVNNIIAYLGFFIGVITILDIVGVPVASLLAGAGIFGLIIGLGSQSLVKDLISGFFIIFEDYYSVGDLVIIEDKRGIVEEIGLKSTKLKGWGGEVYSIPNGTVQTVTNYTRNPIKAVIEVGIAYEENIQNAIRVIEEACQKVYEEKQEFLIGVPEVQGVQDLANSSVNLRVIAEATDMQQWNIERLLRQRIKEEFDQQGVEIPYPRRVVLYGGATDRKDEELQEALKQK